MAKHLPTHLSYKSALVLLPPSSIAVPIENVRRIHDKHFKRWPPHVNLLYPFLASPSIITKEGGTSSPQLKDDISSRIRSAVASMLPFNISLSADPPGTFSHGRASRTVWLGPSSDHVQQLQAALQAEFKECDADQRPFTPHLSVGQARSDHGAEVLRQEIGKSIDDFLADQINNNLVALEWHVDHVYVIEREGFHDRFKIIGSIELDEGATKKYTGKNILS